MIASSRTVKLGAALLALCAHGALALAMFSEPTLIEMEGRTGAQQARLGTSFADMVQGRVAAQTPSETALTAVKPTESEIIKPETTKAVPDPVSPTPVRPIAPAALTPLSTQSAVQTAVTPPTATAESAPDPVHEPPPEKIHPAPRPAPPDPAPRTAEKTPPKPPAPPTAAGNGATTARAGEVQGREAAKARTTGSGGAQNLTGNAAATNYPGQVMRKISRGTRPRVSARGTAVVSFRLTSEGRLAAISISRSSGSAELDRAAVKLVQRAAPFPPPPSGARRAFSVEIKGR